MPLSYYSGQRHKYRVRQWRPQTMTATNHDSHKPWRPQTMTTTNHDGHKPWRPQTMTTTNHDGHKPWRPQTMTATNNDCDGHNHDGHKPWQPQTCFLRRTVSIWPSVRHKFGDFLKVCCFCCCGRHGIGLIYLPCRWPRLPSNALAGSRTRDLLITS